jgi:hypothetical protein
MASAAAAVSDDHLPCLGTATSLGDGRVRAHVGTRLPAVPKGFLAQRLERRVWFDMRQARR